MKLKSKVVALSLLMLLLPWSAWKLLQELERYLRETQETALLAAAARGEVRLLGPNCMGTHSPSARLTYVASPDPTPPDRQHVPGSPGDRRCG